MAGNNGVFFSASDISADTGEQNMLTLNLNPNPPQGTSAAIIDLRMRLQTHTADLLGTYLVSVRYNDGVADQAWQVALQVSAGNYSEQGLQIWYDDSRDVTVQIEPLVSGGSIDVLIIGKD